MFPGLISSPELYSTTYAFSPAPFYIPIRRSDFQKAAIGFTHTIFFFLSLITVAEFLGQYHEEKEPPAWVVRHRAEFHSRFDKNKDGKMDREEAREWVFPEKNDSHDETAHLIDGTDENADGFLSVDEILLHWNLFVGSLATDHGNTLRKVKHTHFSAIQSPCSTYSILELVRKLNISKVNIISGNANDDSFVSLPAVSLG